MWSISRMTSGSGIASQYIEENDAPLTVVENRGKSAEGQQVVHRFPAIESFFLTYGHSNGP